VTIDRPVAEAARWLDVREPGWAERIDLKTLDIRFPSLCIGAQLKGTYGRAFDEWGLAESPLWLAFEELWAEYPAVTNAWRAEVLARRGNKPSKVESRQLEAEPLTTPQRSRVVALLASAKSAGRVALVVAAVVAIPVLAGLWR